MSARLPEVYLTGKPGLDTATVRNVERAVAGLTADDPDTGGSAMRSRAQPGRLAGTPVTPLAAGGTEGTHAMADPHSAVEVHGTVAARGAVSGSDPDAIVAKIERTRESLAQTIDIIAERVSPAGNVRRLRERAMEQAARPEVRLALAAVGLAVVSVTIIRIWGRRKG